MKYIFRHPNDLIQYHNSIAIHMSSSPACNYEQMLQNLLGKQSRGVSCFKVLLLYIHFKITAKHLTHEHRCNQLISHVIHILTAFFHLYLRTKDSAHFHVIPAE